MSIAQKIRPINPFHSDLISEMSSPEEIDNLIKQRIQKLTSDNSSIWTSPEHDRREYMHGIFQYPAMMVPVVQKHIVDIIKYSKPTIKNVIDPFMGSATSLVACMENGLDCYGQDINPLAILIGQVRTGPYPIDSLNHNNNVFFSRVASDENSKIEADFKGIDKWFKKDVAKDLSKLVRAIREEKDIEIRRFYWVNLAEVVRLTSNDRTSTFKLHSRPIEEINTRNLSPVDEFKNRVTRTIKDLEVYRDLLDDCNQLDKDKYKGDKQIYLQDSSLLIKTPNNLSEFFDLLVTSPPYGDNKTTVTYGQHSYLPLQWIDLDDIDALAQDDFLGSTMEIDSRSLGGKIRQLSQVQIEHLKEISPSFEAVYFKLLTTTTDRLSKVLVFIDDLYKVIQQIFRVMKPNSYQVWTIGNRTVGGIEIPNNLILIDIINHIGGKLVTEVKREILNKRMAKRNSGSTLMNFENILIFRKIG